MCNKLWYESGLLPSVVSCRSLQQVSHLTVSLPERYISFARIILFFFPTGGAAAPPAPPPRTLMQVCFVIQFENSRFSFFFFCYSTILGLRENRSRKMEKDSGEFFFFLIKSWRSVTSITVADLGEGLEDQNETQRAEKNVFGDRPAPPFGCNRFLCILFRRRNSWHGKSRSCFQPRLLLSLWRSDPDQMDKKSRLYFFCIHPTRHQPCTICTLVHNLEKNNN